MKKYYKGESILTVHNFKLKDVRISWYTKNVTSQQTGFRWMGETHNYQMGREWVVNPFETDETERQMAHWKLQMDSIIVHFLFHSHICLRLPFMASAILDCPTDPAGTRLMVELLKAVNLPGHCCRLETSSFTQNTVYLTFI